MKAASFAFWCLLAIPIAVHGQSTQTITVVHAVANNRDDPAGAKEIALKDKISLSCDGRDQCVHRGPELVPNDTFRIEVTYSCRDQGGSTRQKGPIRVTGSQEVRLSCKD